METYNEDATVKNLEGIEVPAKFVLCAAIPTVLMGLEALKALLPKSKWFARWAVSTVITAIETFSSVVCNPKK